MAHFFTTHPKQIEIFFLWSEAAYYLLNLANKCEHSQVFTQKASGLLRYTQFIGASIDRIGGMFI